MSLGVGCRDVICLFNALDDEYKLFSGFLLTAIT